MRLETASIVLAKKMKNLYAGYTGSEGIAKIVWAEYDRKTFYRDYVAQRKPCIIAQVGASLFANWSDLDWLRNRIGKENIQVEQKHNDQFGLDRKTAMSFETFCDQVSDGNLYMTTQYQSADDWDDGPEAIVRDVFTPPLNRMVADLLLDFPLAAKGMVLQQMNLWIGGGGSSFVSSGLHHDFHDNFYLLGRGSKKFTIFPPKDAARLYLSGTVHTVHPNGLIVYSQGDTRTGRPHIREDGAFEKDVAEWKVSVAEQQLDSATGDEAAAAEEALDSALADLMQYQDEADDGLSDEAFDDSDSEEAGSTRSPKRAAPAKGNAAKKPKTKGADEKPHELPPSFSVVPPSVLHHSKKANAQFPLLKNTTRIEFRLEEGEILYLPCGWFHEVQSKTSAKSPTSDADCHIALNYWYAPPSMDDPRHCYPDDFWKETLEKQLAEALSLD
ncbi:hypothetical protein HDU91_005437 [Kappamyces sp. JEL0680]|nr:hypothetical protein HDU91_005437 [Kappamyces sp. JEL0680]